MTEQDNCIDLLNKIKCIPTHKKMQIFRLCMWKKIINYEYFTKLQISSSDENNNI